MVASNNRIMIVEDESFVAQDISDCLSKAGYEVCSIYAAGEDALQHFIEDEPDLVVMDILLNGKFNGIETARRLNLITKTPILFLTAYTDDYFFGLAQKTKPYAFLSKPFRDKDLLSNIALAIDRFKSESSLQYSDDRAKISQTLEHVQEAYKNAEVAKKTFLDNISHEFRTPIHHITSYISLVDASALDDNSKKMLEVAKEASLWLNDSITNLLHYCDTDSDELEIQKEPFCLVELLDKLEKVMTMKSHEKGLELDLKIDPTISEWLVGDPIRLQQILIKLIENAILHSYEGKVSIIVEKLFENSNEEWLSFSVADNGPGLSDVEADVIFKPFIKLENVKVFNKGLGLGLPIIKRIVEKMDGEIEVFSQIGKGARFTVRLGFAMPAV